MNHGDLSIAVFLFPFIEVTLNISNIGNNISRIYSENLRMLRMNQSGKLLVIN